MLPSNTYDSEDESDRAYQRLDSFPLLTWDDRSPATGGVLLCDERESPSQYCPCGKSRSVQKLDFHRFQQMKESEEVAFSWGEQGALPGCSEVELFSA